MAYFMPIFCFQTHQENLSNKQKKFAGLIAFNDESIDNHPDIKNS